MTPGTTSSSRARIRAGVGATAALVLLGLVAAPAAWAADEPTTLGPCLGDGCDGGAWQAARGIANEASYWGMSPGHNCTNYVAWRLGLDGIAQPTTHPGNASTWAINAVVDGYLVDLTPEVGAIAQWDGSAGGYGVDGHVAYVEAVYDDGTILVSEDHWRDGAQTGPLTYRVVAASSVSNFIHYATETTRLRVANRSAESWTTRVSGTTVEPRALAATTLLDRGAEIYFPDGGRLWQATPDAGGWTATDTGIESNSTSLSAVTLDGTRPYVMSLDDGVLVMSVRTPSGWQRMSTGYQITGDVSAVDLGGLVPTVFVSQGGRLWQIAGGAEGWRAASTGAEVWGPIAAVVGADGWPVVFNARNGFVFRSWQDAAGWHTESTGVPANGALAAVQTATGPELYLVEDGLVSLITTDGLHWTKTATDLDGGALLTVADLGADGRLVIQVG